MKVNAIRLLSLQNSEHFLFISEVLHIAESNNPPAIDMEAAYEELKQALTDEDTAYKMVRKSAITKDLNKADAECDAMLRGFRSQVTAQLKHFNSTISSAAYRVVILLDTYGNLAAQSYEKQTADTLNLLQELKGKYVDDIAALGLSEWVAEIERLLKHFDTLIKNRYAESAEKAEVSKLRTARDASDIAYKALRERLNAAIIFNGETKYSKIVTELNIVVKRYNDILARRKGTAAAQKEINSEE